MSFRRVLAQREVRWLWLGQIWSQLGDRMTQMILIAIVGMRFPGSSLALAKIMACTVIPAFVVSPLAGAVVDRWDRRRTMIGCDLARTACVAILPLTAVWASFGPTYALVFVLFAIACFFLPARMAILPSLVIPETLVAANSLLTASGMVGATVSLLIGGFLVERVGVPVSCAVAAAAYVASAASVWQVRPLAGPALPAEAPPPRALVAEILEGLQYAFGQRHVQFVLGVIGVLMGASGAMAVAATVLVQQAFGSVTRDLGVFSVTAGLGIFLGTVGYGRFGHRWRKPPLMLVCLLGIGLCLAAFTGAVGVWRSWTAGAIATALLGVCVGPIGIAVNSSIHELVGKRLQGRVFSALGVAMNAALLIGFWLAGIVAEQVGPLGTLLMLSGVLGAAGALGLLWYNKAP